MPEVKLKSGRDKSIRRKHPWIFSGAIDSVRDIKSNGETVEVISADGKLLGYGSFSNHSQISVRMLSFDPDNKPDESFFKRKVEDAIKFRKNIIDQYSTNAYRLINAESDNLPGIIVDKYSDFLVCQFLSAGAEYWKNIVVNSLIELLNPSGIYERSDVDVREKEGLPKTNGILFGKHPDALIEITENNNIFLVDIINGHKTGFYLDQRDNRKTISDYVKDKNVLNCFSYTGAFSVYALKSGAKKVVNLDSSEDSLNIAGKNLTANGFTINNQFENVCDDVFKYLRKLRDTNQQYDLIILDPPKFAESVNQIEKASRGYKDINLLAMKLLTQNGILFTFSCSGHITTELFNKIISDAALDSGRNVKFTKFLTQSVDHTITANFPESLYLKGLICNVD
ncbi:MAG: 23S rRNA methyltransferase [Ignavibacteriales bacterium UTCHB2]|jgi:23S rRNA (cytosine1962-C5)-methyltransferase|nr:MAG: Ribosomal RNA large subunit methyltransferase I [Ignavibacteria bacterium ADurb.Bin266]OQY69596.1 MAG: 23S rRNA methyltransferase [Ignavibacteriales bacterium UTCHB2]HQI40505.1 class I SAM-dependent methyltransferase [Ignavibacteriaceae bacterium]